MGLVSIFLCIFIFSTIVGIRRALSRRKDGRHSATRAVTIRATNKRPRRVAVHKLRWISATELLQLMSSDPDLAVFRMVDEGSRKDRSRLLPGELEITLPELEEALAWIPQGSMVIICRPDGFDSELERRLATILRGHEALLVSGTSEQPAGKFDEMAGEICN